MNTFMGYATPQDGHGIATRAIANQLALNPDWEFLDMQRESDQNGGFILDESRLWIMDDLAVALCAPEWLGQIHAPRRKSFSMFEATRLLESRVKAINQYAESVIVPCQWNVETFRTSGVRVPIDVINLGVDAKDYPLMNRDDHANKPYTFLWSGVGGDMRKGWDLVYRAFHAAGFGKRKDARLMLHFRKMPKGIQNCNDKNVMIHKGKISIQAWRKLLQSADCFVFPSRGEGWGLPPREAASTGLPVIATNFGGLAEGIDYWAMPLRVSGMTKAEYGEWDDDAGDWAEPDFDHLVELMKICFENQRGAAKLGQQASCWLQDNQNWKQTAQKLVEVTCN